MTLRWWLLIGMSSAACEQARAVDPMAQEAGAALDASSGGVEDAAQGQADDAARPTERAVQWVRSEVALEPDGRSAPLHFALDTLARPVLALRTYASDPNVSRALCFQLEDVRADSTTSWVPAATSADYGDYCTRCEQRVAVGSGYGLFILPSAVAPPSLASIELRVALRDCLTLTPLPLGAQRPRVLVVESASFAAPPADAKLVLHVLIVEATPHTFAEGKAQLDATFARMREIWRPAGIELVLRGPLTLPRPPGPIVYSATDRQALSGITRDVKALAHEAGVESSAPWVVLTPCVVREDISTTGMSQPIATTAHVPGGSGVHDEPDGIFVAGELCGGLTPRARYLESETLGAVMAHELGHYLGLFHVRESDGRQDVRVDTQVDAQNLMQANPSADASGLTESQIAIARRHLALAGAQTGNLSWFEKKTYRTCE